jgi:hypothetical protein
MEAGPGSSKDRSSKYNIIRTAETRIAMAKIAEARIAEARIALDSGIIMLTRRNIRPRS